MVTITGTISNAAGTVTGTHVIRVFNQPKVSLLAEDFGNSYLGLWDFLSTTGYGFNPSTNPNDAAWRTGSGAPNDPADAGLLIANSTPLTFPGLVSTASYATGGSNYRSIGRQLDRTPVGRFKDFIYNEVNEFSGTDVLIGKPGTTLYFSLLARVQRAGQTFNFALNRSGCCPYGENNYFVNDAGGGRGEVPIRLMTESNKWVLKSKTETVDLGLDVTVNKTEFIVLKITFNPTNEPSIFSNTTSSYIVSSFINPTQIGGDEPTPNLTTTLTGRNGFRNIALYLGESAGDGSIDEIRIGASYAQVTPSVDPESISVAAPNINVINGTSQATATILPANALDVTLTWSITPTSVATINGMGLITALANGIATVTGVSNAVPTLISNAVITITGQAPSSISISSLNGLTTDGFNLSFTGMVSPANTNNEIEWSTSNTSIATINSQGILIPVSQGTVTVTGASRYKASVFGTAVVDITPVSVQDILLSAANISVYQGTSSVTTTVLPSNASNPNVTISLETGGLAGITLSSGVLATDGTSNGVVTITAVSQSNPSVSKSIFVTISGQNPSAITLNATAGVISTFRGTLEFTATVEPELANQNFTWMVDDVDIATISGSGVLSALSNGVVTVMAKAQNGTIAGVAVVTVTGQSAESIALEATVNPITTKGGSSVISATVSPAFVPNGVTFTVSNPEIATISGLGELKALSDGVVIVTATSTDNSAVSQTITITITGQSDIIVVPTGLTISIPGEIMAGKTETISFVIEPEGITVSGVTFTSSDNSILSIDGLNAIALSSGTVTVTGTLDGTTITASAIVQVVTSVPGSTLSALNNVKIYPNPVVDGVFKIESSVMGSVTVKNTFGVDVAKHALSVGVNSFTIKEKGLYLLVIALQSGEIGVTKLVVE